MEILKQYILVLCSIALLFPSFVSLAHISAHQDERACTELFDTHFHKKSLECELCDFRLTNLNTFTPVTFTVFVPQIAGLQFFDSYQFLSDYQKLSFELRGPPASA
ncbi:MAG TPA: hypothetical protein VLN46_02895 [Gillisia sp.]|nr:hypothetical protein [Gillisia sp.]